MALLVAVTAAYTNPLDKTLKRHVLIQSGVMVKCPKDSKLLPKKITLDNEYIYVFLNTDKLPSISTCHFINRWWNTVIIGAVPIKAVLKDKMACIVIPMFKKSYRYEALINGNHFWFYRK